MPETYIVIKPFRTLTRRLSIGDEITADQCDGALGAMDWEGLGYIEAKAPAEPPALPAPTDEDPLN